MQAWLPEVLPERRGDAAPHCRLPPQDGPEVGGEHAGHLQQSRQQAPDQMISTMNMIFESFLLVLYAFFRPINMFYLIDLMK